MKRIAALAGSDDQFDILLEQTLDQLRVQLRLPDVLDVEEQKILDAAKDRMLQFRVVYNETLANCFAERLSDQEASSITEILSTETMQQYLRAENHMLDELGASLDEFVLKIQSAALGDQ